MRCVRCDEPHGFRLILGSWGIPYCRCSECNAARYSEIARAVESNGNPRAESIQEYLDFCNTSSALKVSK